MSTFKGIIAEFPQIRIDYFRQQPGFKAPLACFLSHVHSDHLVGLESMRAPFVYCSAATKEILLRLEKYHYRINYAKGVLESRHVTYDRSMRKLAKPLPLDTPTIIELAPGTSIRVTLIDANHCIGAVMFLIEGDGRAILYTGDIRAETWWVNSLVQNPVLLPHTLGKRRLDCMYLDTTFATKREPYKSFPSKAEGIRELLAKVSQYPDDTIFYFHSWTFGYENVWIALSAFLESRIHLDDYRARIYGSLSTLDRKQLRKAGLKVQTENKSLRESSIDVREATALCGFRNGNHIQPGCLTSQEAVRIHSCERGMGCRVLDSDNQAEIVHIIPIITRADGIDFEELGAGGGKGDLDQREELEAGGTPELVKLMALCTETIRDEKLLMNVLATIHKMMRNDGNVDLDMQLQKANPNCEDDVSLQTFVNMLSANASRNAAKDETQNRTIRFPYSRHSSYSELCELVGAFQPKDVFPCTVDMENWVPDLSMQNLFGEYCSDNTFRHDLEMMNLFELGMRQQQREKRQHGETQQSIQTTDEEEFTSPNAVKRLRKFDESCPGHTEMTTQMREIHGRDRPPGTGNGLALNGASSLSQMERPGRKVGNLPVPYTESVEGRGKTEPLLVPTADRGSPATVGAPPASEQTPSSPSLPPRMKSKSKRFTNRHIAYEAALGTVLTWADYGGLSSTRTDDQREEEEL